MAESQDQALSNSHTSINPSLKLRELNQPHIPQGDRDELSTKESWTLTANRSTICHPRPRSQSYRQSRLSMSIPIAPRNASISSIISTPTPTTSPLNSIPPHTLRSPSDSNAFLVALAGQERYVFELREELYEAEKELRNLKRNWACHEKSKKKGEIRNMEPLQSIQSPGSDESDNNIQCVIASQKSEADKRKELLETSKNLKNSKETRRTFSGNHARTLSLLSPEKSSFIQSKETTTVQNQRATEKKTTKNPLITGTNRVLAEPPYLVKSLYSPKNMTIGGKQLVDIAEDVKEGFKAGMWTFFEDLRQVTVGDEGINKNSASKISISESLINISRPVAKSNSENTDNKNKLMKISTPPQVCENLIDISPQTEICSDNRLKENSPFEKETTKKNKKSKTLSLAIPTADELDDPWSIWESPTAKSPWWSGSTTNSIMTTPPDSGYFDQDINNIRQPLENPTANLNNGYFSWSSFKKMSSGGLGGNLQDACLNVLKELEDSIVRQYDDKCGPVYQLQKAACACAENPNQTCMQEELSYMSR